MACTFTFFPEAGAWGPTNNLLGIADVLRRRGHRCVFVVEESFAGVFEPHGIEERLMRVQPPPEVPEEPGQFWIDFIRDTAPIFRKPTIEQLGEFIHPTWVALIDGVKYANERVAEILDEVRPDVMVNDIVVSWRALFEYGSPWVRIVSCNPLELEALDLPPIFSGYPAADRTGWDEFRAEYRRTHAETWGEFDAYLREGGAPPLPELHFMHESPCLNIHVYPAEVDYPRATPLGPTWHRLDSCVRATDAPFELPDDFTARDGKLVYLSLGSLGSADVELMQRLVDVLATTPHRVIVSKGPQHEKLRLASNMIGAEFLPQISILPHVDLVITHEATRRPAALLGPVRQRAARGRDGLRRSPLDVRVRGRGARLGGRPAARGRSAPRPDGRDLGTALSRPGDGAGGRPDRAGRARAASRHALNVAGPR
jgi:UDP:flavonoid glycosyltransferase YjiC (YdhE family)